MVQVAQKTGSLDNMEKKVLQENREGGGSQRGSVGTADTHGGNKNQVQVEGKPNPDQGRAVSKGYSETQLSTGLALGRESGNNTKRQTQVEIMA